MKPRFDPTAFILANELAGSHLIVIQEHDGQHWISQSYLGANMKSMIPLGRLSEDQQAAVHEKLIALGKFVVAPDWSKHPAA